VSERAGYAFALAAAALFGVVNVAARVALLDGVPPLWAVGVSYAAGGVLLAPVLARRPAIARRDRPRLAVVVAAGAIAAPILLYHGLARTSAVDASLLLNLEMAFTGALAYVVLRERTRGRELLGLVLIGGGAVLVSLASSGGGATALSGALLVAGASLGWAIDNTASAPLARAYDPRALIAWKTLLGGVVVMIAAFLISGAPSGSTRGLLLAAGAGVGGVAFSSVLFYAALARIGATRTVVAFSASSLVGVALGHFTLGEPVTWVHVAAAALLATGVALATVGRGGGAKLN
jgi:drug/metabolite transporter (DMT)-like permease